MAFKSNSLLFVTLSVVVVASTFCHVFAAIDDRKLLDSFERVLSTLAPTPSDGDWQPIKDVNDPKVVDIAKFALNSENIRTSIVQLDFEGVLNGRFQVDGNGITYELTIYAIDFDEEIECEAIVFENTKDNVRKLIFFRESFA